MLNEFREKIEKKINDLKIMGETDLDKYQFYINGHSNKREHLIICLKMLEVPVRIVQGFRFCEFTTENSIIYGNQVDVKSIYYLTSIFEALVDNDDEEFDDESLSYYISHATEPEGYNMSIFCGLDIKADEDYTNLSRAINAEEILTLDVEKISQEEFIELFPNINSDDEGTIDLIRNDYEDDDYNEGFTSKYRGTYASDVEGLSDDFIDDALGGEPDAYSNID
jgi:hypothetical protein